MTTQHTPTPEFEKQVLSALENSLSRLKTHPHSNESEIRHVASTINAIKNRRLEKDKINAALVEALEGAQAFMRRVPDFGFRQEDQRRIDAVDAALALAKGE